MHLPTILAEKKIENSLTLSLFVPKELAYFEGHFPDVPVLPGVVQLHWVMSYIKEYFGITDEYQRVDALKYQHVIFADYHVELNIVWKADKKQIVFQYTSPKGNHSSGRVVF